MNQTPKEILLHAVAAALGLVTFAVGVHLTIQANIGVAPWDCFILGMQNTFGIQYGNVATCLSFFIIVIDLLLKEHIGIGTVLDALLVGKTVDLCTYLNLVPEQEGLVPGFLLMFLGLVLNGIGQYFYMRVGLSCGPRDALLVALGKRLNRIPIGVVSIMIMAVVVTLGWILGGPIGIGTIVSTFCMGPIMQAVFHIMHFRATDVVHQDIVTSVRILSGKAGRSQEAK